MSSPVVAGCRLEATIGRGGMGVVYRAEQLGLGRKVALKVIAPSLAADERFRRRFEHEARLAATIEHPNVVPIYEAGAADGVLYLMMRLVDGQDLGSRLRERGPLPARDAARIVAQVADALDAAHARGLVHRDVKPGNVLLSGPAGREHVYLTDFGLTTNADVSTATGSGRWLGTLDYVAPEQLAGDPVDARTDVYGLGCTLFEALTGRVPFEGAAPATMWSHVNREAPAPSAARADVPPVFDGVIARAMAKAPEDRFQTAGELGRAALGAAAGDAAPAGPAPRRPRRRVVVVAAAALAVAAGLTALLLRSEDPPRTPERAAPQREPPPAQAFARHAPASGAFTVELPATRGWRAGRERRVGEGLLRTTVRGPTGETIWIDYTPDEPPVFDGAQTTISSLSLPHAELGRIQEYVYRGEPAFCRARPCVLLHLPVGGGGIAVLAGDGDLTTLRPIARRIATSARVR